MYPSGRFGSRSFTGSAIHSGWVEEVTGLRSPSLARSHSWRSVTIDGRHSSVSTRVIDMVVWIGLMMRQLGEDPDSVLSLSLSLFFLFGFVSLSCAGRWKEKARRR